MVSDATEAKERNLVLRKAAWGFDEERAPFNSGRKRCIEGAATVPVLPRPLKRNSTGRVRPPCRSRLPIRCILGSVNPKDVPRSCPHYLHGLRLPDMGYSFPDATNTEEIGGKRDPPHTFT
jgi:hypothetical protein